MSKYITVKQAAEYLNVTPMTIYRWIDEGKLKAVKTTDGLLVERASAEFRQKWMRRIRYDGLVFSAAVLMKYHQARQKYRVTTKHKGDIGWISLQAKYLKGLSKKELARQYFKPVKYHKVKLEGGYAIVVVSERDFDRLPRSEKSKWLRFKMSPARLQQEIRK